MFSGQFIRSIAKVARPQLIQNYRFSTQIKWVHKETTNLQSRLVSLSPSAMAIQNLRQLLQKCQDLAQISSINQFDSNAVQSMLSNTEHKCSFYQIIYNNLVEIAVRVWMPIQIK